MVKCIIKNIIKTLTEKDIWVEFSSGLVVKILGFHCQVSGSIPCQGTEIPQALWSCKAKKKRKKEERKYICNLIYIIWGSPGSSAGKESSCNAGQPSSIPWPGRSSGEGIGYSLQYSWASLVVQTVKNPTAMLDCRCGFDPWFGKIP